MSVSDSNRPYLSIGEVLGLLLEEFPDVTISKIRFLESQGLIDPERTPSGYRKFYDADVERLRVILREQRQNFLPLRVIRDRLESGEIDDTSGSLTVPRGIRNVFGDETGEMPLPDPATIPTSTHPAARFAVVESARPAPPALTPAAAVPAPIAVAALQESPVSPVDLPLSAQQYSAAELCRQANLTAAQLGELESFGLLAARGRGGAAQYSGHDVAIASAASSFLGRGVEGRHLRAWRQAADREVALFEQLVMPLMRQRNPQARQQASHELDELRNLGAALRRAIVDSALSPHLDDRI
jgi:DNA-binding transcriptional MerR regulator